ncbi:MAG TPA: COX15/CtaA family protein [Elusimicrobiota bacterium]|jgi:heme A synthase|nr:COX15/CtaA family protein [Elusimicrobiota bacterium]
MTSNKPLRRFAGFSALCAFVLIAAGGMVTSTGSGLSVPDWPLSYGKAMPPMVGGVLFEHGHRMIAGFVATLTWLLAAWIWLKEPRRWVRRLAAAAAGGIVLQAVLGGITVLYGLPPAVSALHACLGQALFCALLCLWDATGKPPEPSYGAWTAGAATAAGLFAQLAFGAVYRHTGGGFPFHLLGAMAVFVLIGRLVRSARAWSAPVYVLMLVLPFQLALGLVALVVRGRRLAPQAAALAGLHGTAADVFPSTGYLLPSFLTALHVACGAALLGAAVLWTQRALREAGQLA